VDLLKTRFVPFALDNVAHPNLTRSEIDFLNSFESGVGGCTFGMTIFSADGKRLAPRYGGSYDPSVVRRHLEQGLADFKPESVSLTLEEDKDEASRLHPPEGGLALYVSWRLLHRLDDAAFAKDPRVLERTTSVSTLRCYQSALGSDRLWVRKDEAEALAGGSFPASLRTRILRDHLRLVMSNDATGFDPVLRDGRLEGSFAIKDADHRADYLGFVEARDGKVLRFDLVIKGWARQSGFCGNIETIPKGTLAPLALVFELADPKEGLAQVLPSQMDFGNETHPASKQEGIYRLRLPLGLKGESLSYYR
jgi:hypothetical protein